MKTTLLLFSLFLFSYRQAPIDKLVGKWQLQKIEMKSGKILHRDGFDFVNISKDGISFYNGCNTCGTRIISIDDTCIILDEAKEACTMRYCVGPDLITINYSGKYELHDSLLIITNAIGKEYLKRQK